MTVPLTPYALAIPQNPSSALTDFIMAIDLSLLPASWWAIVDTTDGTKGRAYKADGVTEIPVEWVAFDSVNETGWAFIQYTGTLATSGSQGVRIYPPVAANTSTAVTDTYGRNAVWSSGFEAVYHLEEDPSGVDPQFIDSTGNGFNLTAVNSPTQVSSQLGNGVSFDDSLAQRLEHTLSSPITAAPFTIEAWATADDNSANVVVSMGNNAANDYWMIHQDTSIGSHAWRATASDQFVAISADVGTGGGFGVRQHLAFVESSDSNREIFVDGVGTGSPSTSTVTPDSVNRLYIGSFFDGQIDEVRISSVARSSDWIAETYLNQSSNDTYWSDWGLIDDDVWTKYKEITYEAGGIPSENLADFPKLVKITADPDIAAELSGGGGIRFTDVNGEEVPFGLYPTSDLAAGTIKARVKFSLSSTANVGDVIGRVYYSSAGETVERKSSVVIDGYKLFAPLEEDPSGSPPQIFDWVTETYVGTSVGAMTAGDLVAAQVENGLDFDGSNDYINLGTLAGVSHALNRSFTIEAWIRRATAVGGCIFSTGKWEVSLRVTAAGRLEFVETNTAVVLTGTGTRGTATWFHAALTVGSGSPANVKLYLDGAADGSTTTTRTFTDGPEVSTIGSEVISGTAFALWSGIIDELRISNSERSANWIAYARYDDFNNSDTFDLGTEQGGGGVTDTVLEADPGAFTLTGGQATLLKGHRLLAEPGSFAMTGGTAVLSSGRNMIAEQGLFSITGGTVNLAKSSRMIAEPGTFVLTTGSADLKRGMVMSAESGSFIVSGGDAFFNAGMFLHAEPGQFTIIGGEVSLNRAHIMEAEAGEFMITPGDALMNQGFYMETEAGLFTIAGGEVNLGFDTRLIAEPGMFEVTGGEVLFSRNHVLTAEPGIFIVTGGEAMLDKTGEFIVGGKFIAAQVYFPGFKNVQITSPGFKQSQVD